MITIKTTTEFKRFHPIVGFAFFAAVIGFSMFFMHPAYLAVSLLCAFSCCALLGGLGKALRNMLFLLPMMAVMAVVNPAFNHEGVTILMYLPDGNPLTLESILYGVAASAMFAAVIYWFSCFNEVISGDKFMYLFGKLIPTLSLILSMTLRFIPAFTQSIREISAAQKPMGNDIGSGSVIKRTRAATVILSAAVNRALESAVDTSDSMRARGYGLPGRTSFSVYRFSARDGYALVYILCTSACILTGHLLGGNNFTFFPSLHGVPLTSVSVGTFVAYLALCIYPTVIELTEVRRWQALK